MPKLMYKLWRADQVEQLLSEYILQSLPAFLENLQASSCADDMEGVIA